MQLNLENKKALITGSSAGIGEGIARKLAEQGMQVLIHGRDHRKAERVADEIVKNGGKADYVIGDLTDQDSAMSVCAQALSKVRSIDVLINNAGSYLTKGWFEAGADAWDQLYKTDVLSAVRMILFFAPKMKENGWGRIIQIASAGGERVPANYMPFYASAKAALLLATKSLAIELGGTGITVNAITPGPVATDTFKQQYIEEARQAGRKTDWNTVLEDYIERYMQNPPVRKFPSTEDIGALAAFLCSPYADTISGASYLIDSGFSLTGFKQYQPHSELAVHVQ